MKVLVTGGAGYIGSFMVKALLDRGVNVVVLDNLERGHRQAVDSRAEFIEGDIKDSEKLKQLFLKDHFEAILHFAGYISVEESTKNPSIYEENNVLGSEKLFTIALREGKVNKFIFSSSAAVYGNPIKIPIPEDHPTSPTSPYGRTKMLTEQTLTRLRKNNPLISFASLRYFNAAGASLNGKLGEDHEPETHIIPLAIKAATEGSQFSLFGVDYDTFDGTCIRDYIHVLDLVEAHLLGLDKISKEPGGYIYNVGTGIGYSNRQVIDMVKKITARKVHLVEKERRSGDAKTLIADPSKIKKELSFSPKYSDLQTIVKTAWQWHSKKFQI